MRPWRIVILVIAAWAAPVRAEPAPIIAPPPEWVEPTALPAPNPAEAGKPFQMLLVSSQSRYAETAEHFAELATVIQNPQGLQAMGNVVLPWQPDRYELVVHKVHIVRGGKTIDLLANGQAFTVLRRENNLESAMLDGVLTAVMQPEGLAVGDVLDIAFTIREKPGALALRGENFFFLSPDGTVRHLRYRQIWADGTPMRWRATPALGKPRVAKSRWGTLLSLDIMDAKGPKVPEDAPARYAFPALLEMSAYKDWNEISRTLAPVYSTARALKAESPLRVEIAKIAAADPDPGKRALAALRLVQDKIRYLALAMGEGGLVPASADQTWTRKFGDCKGKTATLLALLDGLGIEAEPVAVNQAYGTALADHLPRVTLFNHVIVRARIGGKSLWLDGTRNGDRSLDDLASYPGGFGLPIRADGSALEPLPLLAPRRPLIETAITYDASGGFSQLVPFSGAITYRGEMATLWRTAMEAGDRTEMQSALKNAVPNVPNEDVEIGTIETGDETGDFRFMFSGKTRLPWTKAPGSNAIRVKFSNDTISWRASFEREDASGKDAAFALDFPNYQTSRETIVLPAKGAGFTLDANNFDREVAATRISRRVTLEDGKAIAVSSFLRLRPEISAAEAAKATTALAEVNADTAYVRSPDDYRPDEKEVRALLLEEPTKAAEFVTRGYYRMQQGKVADALTDFDRAISLSPNLGRAHANRGLALVAQEKFAEAETSLARAAEINEEDSVVQQGYGFLRLAQDKPIEAAERLSRALALEPDNPVTLVGLAQAHQRNGKIAEALAVVERALPMARDQGRLLELKARLAAFTGDQDSAIASADRMSALAGWEFEGLALKGDLLRKFGRSADAQEAHRAALGVLDRDIAKETDPDSKRGLRVQRVDLLVSSGRVAEAIQEASAAVRARPDATTELNTRCWARALANVELELALKDCDLALRNDPENAAVADSRAFVKLRLGRLDEAIADFDDALRWSPNQVDSLYGRGLAKLRKGDREGGERDLAAARRHTFDIESRFKVYGLAP